jgi:NhaP-type Na+/H+ or K+/H+ antiporter
MRCGGSPGSCSRRCSSASRWVRIPYAVALPLGLPGSVALLFGSLVGATDPVAVTAVLNEVALPARMIIIPEAESLVNDGMAITLYTGFSELGTPGGAGVAGLGELFLREVLLGLASGNEKGPEDWPLGHPTARR